MARKKSRQSLSELLKQLSATQQELVRGVVERLLLPVQTVHHSTHPPFTAELVRVLAESLQLHHTLSARPLSKENFEFVLIKAAQLSGQPSIHGPRGLAKHDVEINQEKYSLKTQADANIKRNVLHISKFMELGKGDWSNLASLEGQRDRFLKHLEGYDRICTLRYFRNPSNRAMPAISHEYELVDIPKKLFLEAVDGIITMQQNSKQTPKPGYCRVYDSAGLVKYALYFDGGSERKLQIKVLNKSLCTVIATWVFDA